MSASSEQRKALRTLEREGFSWGNTKGGHYWIQSPAGGRTYCAVSPSDRRSHRNLMAWVKRERRAGEECQKRSISS